MNLNLNKAEWECVPLTQSVLVLSTLLRGMCVMKKKNYVLG